MEEKIISRIDDLIKKGQDVISTHRPNPPNVIGFPTLNSERFTEWKTQVLNFFINLLGNEHVYTKSFESEVQRSYENHVGKGIGILKAVKEDVIGGYLINIKTLISAEIFANFIEMAEHLIEDDYKDAAALLCGAALENGLKKIAEKNNIKLKQDENLNSLNKKCSDANLYNRLVQKRIHIWIDIRNNSAHGNFKDYSKEDVLEMIKGVRDFLIEYLK
jgi:hypothetical protein